MIKHKYVLSNLLENNDKEFGDRLAFIMKLGYRTKKFNYSDVYNLSRRVALFLDSLGIGKGDKVLVLAPNSPYWAILFWGAILNGSILVPVNTQSTTSIIEKIVKDTEVNVIFKSKLLNQELPGDIRVFNIEFLEEYLAPFHYNNFNKKELCENDVIEILYTSGTTGDPKGVVLTHKNILTNVFSVSEVISLAVAKERLLSVLPLTHIFEQTIGFFLPQLYASTIVFTHSYSAILDLMQKYNITKLLAVPELLKLLMSKIEDEYSKKTMLFNTVSGVSLFRNLKKISLKFNNKYLSRLLFCTVHKKFGGKLDIIASGGAFLDPELEKTWNALGFTILQGYGLTETSPVISCNTYNKSKLGSVGKVVKNINLKLASDGEILVKGPSVFSSYYNDKKKTDSSFTVDGFFKTGDIGEIDNEGFLFLKGRKKYVIIGPGAQNIYPEDIELEINKVDGVVDSCVLGLPQKSGVVQIYAVLLAEDKNIDFSTIVEQANSRLASYQQISGFIVWPELDFPRSATKKIKREPVLSYLLGVLSGKAESKVELFHTPLMKLLNQVTGIDLSVINDKTKIVSGLQLDSLMRVELIIRIEDLFGVFIDEDILTSKITVGELQDYINSCNYIVNIKAKKPVRWPRNFFVKIVRSFLQFFFIPLLRVIFRFKVIGIENLDGVDGPVIFMPNHISYLDGIAVLMALPCNIRFSLGFAAAKDVLYEKYKSVSWLVDLYFNTFSFPRDNGSGIKIGLDLTGEFIDDGYSVVLFPEGKMSESGDMLPLKKGAGLIAIEMGVPIIPIKIIGTSRVAPYGKIFPRSISSISVIIGKPIRFGANVSYEEATRKIMNNLSKL